MRYSLVCCVYLVTTDYRSMLWRMFFTVPFLILFALSHFCPVHVLMIICGRILTRNETKRFFKYLFLQTSDDEYSYKSIDFPRGTLYRAYFRSRDLLGQKASPLFVKANERSVSIFTKDFIFVHQKSQSKLGKSPRDEIRSFENNDQTL